jgi:hypothetical protein
MSNKVALKTSKEPASVTRRQFLKVGAMGTILGFVAQFLPAGIWPKVALADWCPEGCGDPECIFIVDYYCTYYGQCPPCTWPGGIDEIWTEYWYSTNTEEICCNGGLCSGIMHLWSCGTCSESCEN